MVKRNISISNSIMFGIIALFILLLLALSSCQKHNIISESTKQTKVYPPDLSSCTRLEIQYIPSALDCLIGSEFARGLFTAAEIKDIEAIKKIVVRDSDRIEAIANDLSTGTYRGTAEGPPRVSCGLKVVCYQGEEILTYFEAFGPSGGPWLSIQFEGKETCSYPIPLVSLDYLTIKLRPVIDRLACACNLGRLITSDPLSRWSVKEYPKPDEWCDVLMRIDGEYLKNHLSCPRIAHGSCSYALNPDCRRDSPPDTVLLFETKDGWNQHGGPELFTFDNHNPRGGCVLLRDGTIKFIRTEEELNSLRWKP
jgi:hypothetical protein